MESLMVGAERAFVVKDSEVEKKLRNDYDRNNKIGKAGIIRASSPSTVKEDPSSL